MSELFTPPADGWYLVPPGVPCWGRTVMHTPDGRTYTNVPSPEGTLTIAAASELWVQAPGTTVTPASGWKIADSPVASTGLAHDCTTWTERTEKRLAMLEDAVNRIADTVQYLLLRLEGDK